MPLKFLYIQTAGTPDESAAGTFDGTLRDKIMTGYNEGSIDRFAVLLPCLRLGVSDSPLSRHGWNSNIAGILIMCLRAIFYEVCRFHLQIWAVASVKAPITVNALSMSCRASTKAPLIKKPIPKHAIIAGSVALKLGPCDLKNADKETGMAETTKS